VFICKLVSCHQLGSSCSEVVKLAVVVVRLVSCVVLTVLVGNLVPVPVPVELSRGHRVLELWEFVGGEGFASLDGVVRGSFVRKSVVRLIPEIFEIFEMADMPEITGSERASGSPELSELSRKIGSLFASC